MMIKKLISFSKSKLGNGFKNSFNSSHNDALDNQKTVTSNKARKRKSLVVFAAACLMLGVSVGQPLTANPVNVDNVNVNLNENRKGSLSLLVDECSVNNSEKEIVNLEKQKSKESKADEADDSGSHNSEPRAIEFLSLRYRDKEDFSPDGISKGIRPVRAP